MLSDFQALSHLNFPHNAVSDDEMMLDYGDLIKSPPIKRTLFDSTHSKWNGFSYFVACTDSFTHGSFSKTMKINGRFFQLNESSCNLNKSHDSSAHNDYNTQNKYQ